MEPLIWLVVLGGTAFLIWFGYHLMVRKIGEPVGGELQRPAACHLCRREFPVGEMVSRDKTAGFINYFCGECITALHEDYVALRKRQGIGAANGH